MTPLSTEDQIVVALRRISQAIERYSRRLWQDFGLTAPQVALLREIREHDSSPSALAEVLHLAPPTVAGMLNRLQQRNLIMRTPDERDRRGIIVGITDEGRELVGQAPALLRDRVRRELRKLESWEQSQILSTLQRVGTLLHVPEEDEAPFFFHGDPGGAENDPAPTEDASTENVN